MEGAIIMSREEAKRVRIMEHVVGGRITLKAAMDFLGVCYRQAKRIKGRYLKHGIAGLVHGNRGRVPANAYGDEMKYKVVELHQQKYFDSNDTHFTELIAEREGLDIGRESVRKILRAAGIKPKRKRRPPRHHSRRPRREQFGMMAIWDGSPHRWFGEEREPCCLMSCVDDATGQLLGALFVPAESSAGYLRLLDMVLREHGAPLSIYHDRHSSLVRCDNHWSLEEQIRGEQYPTHVGLVLSQIGIISIPANSPQAKGRVERRFGILQDRMIVELRLAGIKDIDTANRWLKECFIQRYNKRFTVEVQKKGSAFRKMSKQNIYDLVAFNYEAVVGNDNCVRLGGMFIDVPPGQRIKSFAKQRVTVKQHIDGAWTVWSKDQIIAKHKPTEFSEPARQWKRRNNDSKLNARGAKEVSQVYIASKPAFLPRGHFPLAVKGTY